MINKMNVVYANPYNLETMIETKKIHNKLVCPLDVSNGCGNCQHPSVATFPQVKL